VNQRTLRTAIYIDGYNLYYGRLRHTKYKWLDVVTLFESILKIQDPASSLEAVKYFTAPALARFSAHVHDSMIAQQNYHRALSALYPAKFSITFGTHSFDKNGTLLPTFIAGMPFDRSIKSHVWKLEEKKTDVNLAIAMYRDVAKDLYDQIIICSNDSDAEPALAALKEDFPQLVIGVVSPLKELATKIRSVSASLSSYADWTRKYISDDELEQAQLPSRVPTNKKPVDKPPHW
jgi:uncharacterized LabA/DUF88 family protein